MKRIYGEDLETIIKAESIMEYGKWFKKIPFIKFKAHWNVQIIPPFNGAVVRFRIESKGVNLSIYLDCYDRLGYFGEPYWELYPHNEDIFRCAMNDTESLLKAISESLNEIE